MNLAFRIGVGLLLGLLACNRDAATRLERREAGGIFALLLPANLSPRNDMHDYAQLQYGDDRSGLYVMGLEDPKKKIAIALNGDVALKTYFSFVESAALSSADTTLTLKGPEDIENPSYKGRYGDYQVEVTQGEKKYRLFYRIAVFETSAYFFQVVIWMPLPLYEQRKDQVDAILASFEVIENA